MQMNKVACMQRAAFDWVATITLNSDRALKKKKKQEEKQGHTKREEKLQLTSSPEIKIKRSTSNTI